MLIGRGLCRRLPDRVLFEAVDFDLPDGFLWVRGPSGSGKTELLRRVAGLAEGEGELTLNRDTPASLGWPEWRRRVAYVPQDPPRWPGTGREAWERVQQLGVHRTHTDGDPVALASRWNLPADRWNEPMRQLSGGEVQRLWLSVVLATGPEVLLLDEPTSALDPETTAAVEADLSVYTGLLVTHLPEQGARLCAQELVLR